MQQFFASRFFAALKNLGFTAEGFTTAPEKRDPLPGGRVELLVTDLSEMETFCRQYGFQTSLDVAGVIRMRLGVQLATNSNLSGRHVPFDNMQAVGIELNNLCIHIPDDIGKKIFTHIPLELAPFYEKEKLFGDEVFDKFPDAQKDIREAGNCLAADLHTAAAFHLIRVVEIGLRELARKQKVKFAKTPLDYAGWKAVVDAIGVKLQEKIPKARGPRQAKALRFTHDTLTDFKAFEVIRNEIMHCRWRCNDKEAMGLFIRVHEFMKRLAENLPKEPHGKRTNPI
jgi:hypothetical protein